MPQFVEAFQNVKEAFDSDVDRDSEIVCKNAGPGRALYLQKESWTNPGTLYLPNGKGVFFSIWTSDRSWEENRLLYNIHALKMRQLEGYSITSIDFAAQFRKEFAKLSGAWPNVSTKYGPLTLMQGWIDLNIETLEPDILGLFESFKKVSPIIDRLLEQRRVNRGRFARQHSSIGEALTSAIPEQYNTQSFNR